MTNGMTGAVYHPTRLDTPEQQLRPRGRNWTLTNLPAQLFEATPEEQEDGSHDKRQHVR
jgi:hypothetical protein